jgi:hypothetical protein
VRKTDGRFPMKTETKHTPLQAKYIVFFPFKEGNEGKTPSQYPQLHETAEEMESTKRFLTFHGACISHIEHREPTPKEIVDDISYASVRALVRALAKASAASEGER